MANVKVRLKDASNNVLHPETDWSVVLNKPSITLKYPDGSHSTSPDSEFDVVATLVGAGGEAWDTYSNGDKSIVIGNSDNALGFCGANSKRLFTLLHSKHQIKIATDGNIEINSSETGNQSVSLANYPIKWSAISNKPNYIPTDARDIVFGHYVDGGDRPDGTGYDARIYPAIRIIDYSDTPSGSTYKYTHYYFNGTSWTKLTDASKFFPGF